MKKTFLVGSMACVLSFTAAAVQAQETEITVTDAQSEFSSARAAALELLGSKAAGPHIIGAIEFAHDGKRDFHLLGEARANQYQAFDVVICNLSSDAQGILDLASDRAGGEPHEDGSGRRVAIKPQSCRLIAVEVYNLAANAAMPSGQDVNGPSGNKPWTGLIFFVGQFAS